jgi:hypothetical protein
MARYTDVTRPTALSSRLTSYELISAPGLVETITCVGAYLDSVPHSSWVEHFILCGSSIVVHSGGLSISVDIIDLISGGDVIGSQGIRVTAKQRRCLTLANNLPEHGDGCLLVVRDAL